MVRACRAEAADDYVVATGEGHTVRDFVAAAFARAGIDDWEPLVHTDPALTRPADAADLTGDASRARERLGWAPTVGFEELVGRMVDANANDLRLTQLRGWGSPTAPRRHAYRGGSRQTGGTYR